MDNVILNKVASLDRCLKRIRDEYVGYENEFTTNYTKQDAILLNLERACQVSLDLALYIIKQRKLGLPQSNRDSFKVLEKNKILTTDLSGKMQKMVGFRNIAVHQYDELDLKIIKAIIEDHLKDFKAFKEVLINLG